MDHFVAYHNEEVWGPYNGGPFFTATRYKDETLINNKLWVFVGKGTPRRYILASAGLITGSRPAKRPPQYRSADKENGLLVIFDDKLPGPVDVTDEGWFRVLQANQQNFRFGLSSIKDAELVDILDKLDVGGVSSRKDNEIADVGALERDTSLDETTRLALINARLGQGRFRKELERRWENACAVIGCTVLPILRASHIKPWRESSNAERLDPGNGLLLAAHLDALFDVGLISFGDDGRMLVSKQLHARDRSSFQLPSSLRKRPTQPEKRYLAHHRQHCFKP